MLTPHNNRPKITQTDINNGYVTRYFVRNISTKVVTEIDKKQYEAYKNNSLYERLELPWIISGFANNIISTDGQIIYGAKHKNAVTICFYERRMPGLTRLFGGLSCPPVDINPKLLEYSQGTMNTKLLEYFQGTMNREPVTPINEPKYSSTLGGSVSLGRTFGNEIVPPPTPAPPVVVLPTLTLSSTVVNFEFTQSASVPSTQYIIITEASGSAVTGLTIQSQSSWVSASLNTTSTPASMSVTITTTNLPTGSYTSSITVSSSVSAINSTVVLPVTASVASSAGSYTALDIAAAELSYYVLRSDNTLWSWGWNGEGELGLGDNTDRALPTQVSGSWESISVGAYSLLAIKTDNTLWAAGLNWDGRLGLGDETDRNTMTQVTGTGWEKVSTAIGYGDHTLAVKTDGTLWAWGGNGSGQLGIGSSGSADQLTPIQVGSDTNWSYVHAGYDRSFALKTNGTLWSWGSNLSTALGQGDSNPVAVYVTPTQVGADTNWTKLSSGWAFTFALKSNGTLWVTGTNVSYGLGVGSTNTSLEYNTFTQVGSATDWVDISCGYEQCVARKTDGSIYTWGYNADGELGLGDTTNRASPTQVGTATDWTDISGGFYDALAVKNNVLTYWGWNYNDYLGTGNEPELSPVSLPYSSNILY